MAFYGATCVDDADLEDLESLQSSGLSAEQRQSVLQQVQLQSMQQSTGPLQRAHPLEMRPPKPPPRLAPLCAFIINQVKEQLQVVIWQPSHTQLCLSITPQLSPGSDHGAALDWWTSCASRDASAPARRRQRLSQPILAATGSCPGLLDTDIK